MPATATYDLAQAVRSVGAHDNRDAIASLRELGGEEARVSRAISEAIDPDAKRGVRGFWAPLSALVPRSQKRDLTSVTGSGAVAIRRAPIASFTDVLRRKAVLGVLGAEFASFWGGDKPVKIPRKKSGVTAAWVAEGSQLSESHPEFEDDEASATKSLGACVIVSRKMWLHAGGQEFQDYLVDEMGAALAAEVDRAGLAGTGTNQPTGLFNLVGIPTASINANGGPLTRAPLVGAMKAVHLGNGDSPATARMGWVANPDVEAKLRLTDGGMGDGPLWSDADRILGKPAVATTSVPNNLAKGSGTGLSALAYGNWSDVLINHAPAVYVLINPHSMDRSGDIRITAWLEVRILFRHLESFIAFKDVQTT